MDNDIKACVYSQHTDEQYRLTLRNSLAKHPNLQIVTEADSQESLTDSLARLPVTLLVMDLDPAPDAALAVMDEIAARFPALAIIALSDSPDTELILSAMRSGCRQFITKPIDTADLIKALKPLTRAASGQAKTERVICVMGSSGGCGVTTICANLAIELAQLDIEPCALVDLQLEFGSVGTYFDIRPSHTIADLTNTPNEIDSKITEQALTILPSKIAILPRPESITQVAQIDPQRVAQVLKVLASKHDSVVVDTPCRFDRIGIATLEMATTVLVVMQLSVPSIRNAQRLYKTLVEYGMPAEKIQFVANRFTRNSPITPENVEEYLKTGLFALVPNDYQTVQAALDFGRPLLSESPDSPVRKAIAEIARRIHKGDFTTVAVQSKSKQGFFNRWLK